MFAKTEIQKPNYTVRILLNHIHSDRTEENPVLKPFSHFTLACTHNNESNMSEIFDSLAAYLQGPLILAATEVVNLGTEVKPLWAVRLNLGTNEEAFRMELSSLFDHIMCHEMNGVRYLWSPTEDQQMKCPHITIGPNAEDQNKAQKLVDDAYTFIFDRIDYKQVGPHDPHVTMDLSVQNATDLTMGSRK